jgi:hypothetical protein
MIERTEACFGIRPKWLAADSAYGSASNLDWLVNEQGIAPHVPVIDKSQRASSAFCGLADCAFAAPAARSLSSRWQPSRKT